MKICPNCNQMVSDTAKFCVKCGFNIKKYEEENVQEEYFCPECGTKFSGGDFCPECGTSINEHLNESVDNNNTMSFDFSSLQNEALKQQTENELSAFEYEQMSNGKCVIKKLKNKSELIVAVPDCVQMIEANAFEDSSVIDVTLPEGLIKIGARAFANCADLETINMPSTLKIVEEEAFLDCAQLKIEEQEGIRYGKDALKGTVLWVQKEKLEKEEQIRKKEEEQKIIEAKKREYTKGVVFTQRGNSCHVVGYEGKARNVVIPSIYNDLPVTEISVFAFDGNDMIESVIIPNTVTSIGDYAFRGCKRLDRIEIPDSVVNIGVKVFGVKETKQFSVTKREYVYMEDTGGIQFSRYIYTSSRVAKLIAADKNNRYCKIVTNYGEPK